MCLSSFAKGSEFLAPETSNLNLRRNFISLFDSVKNELLRIDVTLGVSLLDRHEQEKVSSKLERTHPSIPNAVFSSEGIA